MPRTGRPKRDREPETASERLMRQQIDDQSRQRADASRQVDEHSRAIAALCLDARSKGVSFATLARWVKVAGPDGDLRPVTRQAVEQMCRAFAGGPRQSNGHEPSHDEPSGVNMSVFQ